MTPTEQDCLRACVDLDRQIVDAYATIDKLKTRRNTFAFTARLPPEILSKIFESLIALTKSQFYGKRQWMHLMEVCRHWRSVMLESPRLWSLLAFNKTKLTSAMLRRSKASPLVVKVDLFHPEFTQGAVTLALSHISRIRVLHIKLVNDRYSKGALAALNQHAPLLTCLRLTTHSQTPHVFPPSLFPPCLRHLVIHYLTIPWDSPLLVGLTYLEICGSPHAPSLGELRAVLSHCPALNTLILSDNLPDTEDQQHQLQDPIPLPTLARLDLKGPVAGCDVVVRSLSFPPTTAVMVWCDFSLDISSKLPHLLSGLDARRGDGVSVDCLEIRVPRPSLLTFKTWTSTNPKTLEHPSVKLTLQRSLDNRGPNDDEDISASLIHTACQGLSPTEILNADFCLPFRTNSRRWTTMLGSLKNLQVLEATAEGYSGVEGLLSALTPRLIKGEKELGPSNVFLPHLRELTLNGSHIWDDSGFETLRDGCVLHLKNYTEI